MSGLLTLQQMIDLYGKESFPVGEDKIRFFLEGDDDDNRVMGHLLRAANFYAAGQPEEALEYFLRLRKTTNTLSLPVIGMLIWLRRGMNNPQQAAYDCLCYAEDAVSKEAYNLALEACSAAVFLDQAGRFEITKYPRKILRITSIYEQAALHMQKDWFPEKPAAKSVESRVRVALVTGNLVDHVVAYSRRVLNFAKYLDREKYDVRVYSTENLTAREKPHFPFGIENGGTLETAPASVAALSKMQVPLCCAPRNLGGMETARWMINRLREDQIDMAIFQTGIASPVDWLTARLAPVPVKAGIHIGSSPFNSGFDAYFFDNPINIEREREFWQPEMGERILLNSGVDIDAIESAPLLPRKELGIREHDVLIGTLSNHLGERMTPDYIQVIVKCMQDNPNTSFVGFGIPPGAPVIRCFRDAGLADRVFFPGPVSISAVVLKMLDVYACEFPVGGSESVKEAIACGVPVVAMKAGEGHAESAAANIVGPSLAINQYDPMAYREQLDHWVKDADARRLAGADLRRRARENYSFQVYAGQVMKHMERMKCKV